MASRTRIPKAELTGVYGALVKRMSRKMLGDVPEPVALVWHNRRVLGFSFSVARQIRKWNRCDENLKSFAHMAVASVVGFPAAYATALVTHKPLNSRPLKIRFVEPNCEGLE